MLNIDEMRSMRSIVGGCPEYIVLLVWFACRMVFEENIEQLVVEHGNIVLTNVYFVGHNNSVENKKMTEALNRCYSGFYGLRQTPTDVRA